MSTPDWMRRIGESFGVYERRDDEEDEDEAIDEVVKPTTEIGWSEILESNRDVGLTPREAGRRAWRMYERATHGDDAGEIDAYGGVFNDPNHRDRNDR